MNGRLKKEHIAVFLFWTSCKTHIKQAQTHTSKSEFLKQLGNVLNSRRRKDSLGIPRRFSWAQTLNKHLPILKACSTNIWSPGPSQWCGFLLPTSCLVPPSNLHNWTRKNSWDSTGNVSHSNRLVLSNSKNIQPVRCTSQSQEAEGNPLNSSNRPATKVDISSPHTHVREHWHATHPKFLGMQNVSLEIWKFQGLSWTDWITFIIFRVTDIALPVSYASVVHERWWFDMQPSNWQTKRWVNLLLYDDPVKECCWQYFQVSQHLQINFFHVGSTI